MEPAQHQPSAPGGRLPPTRPSLLERLRNHDESKLWPQSWKEFSTIYVPFLKTFAEQRGVHKDDVDDVVQEIVIGTARSLPKFEYNPNVSRFTTWLCRIAEHKIFDYFRKRRRRGQVIDSLTS